MADILPSSLPPGTMLGDYKLLKATGQGGFGITYTAWDTRLNRRVAIKECMPAGLCFRDPDSGKIRPISDAACADYHQAMADMHREARTLASLSHAAIVGVFDVFESQGSLFYVMPWLEGGSLRERMQQMRENPTATDTAEVQRWLACLLDGLAYLHGKGIIHRDIKPANILFDENGNPVIIDFGAALNRAARTTTSDTTTQGEFSPAYGSPEQLTGKGKIGPWTDLFSLAAVFYELIAGERPEPADHRLMEESLKPLQHFPAATAYPAPLLAAVMRNLSLSPQARCADSEAWQRMLHTPAPLSFLLQHRRYFIRGGIILLVAVAAGAIGAGIFSRTTQQVPSQQAAVLTQSSPQELIDTRQALDKKVREYFHIPELLKRCDEFAARRDAFFERKKQEYELEKKKFLASLDSYADYGAAMDALGKKDKELQAAWNKWQKEFERQYRTEISYKVPADATMKDTYPAATSDEVLLLPTVCDRITQECTQKVAESSFYYNTCHINSIWMTEVEREVKKHFFPGKK